MKGKGYGFDGSRGGQDMIDWTCNLCGQRNKNEPNYFHRELGLCIKCGSNVRFRAIWRMVEKYVLEPHGGDLSKITGVGLSDAQLYAKRLARLLNYKNTYYHQAPFLDITDPVSASQYSSLDFVICSDVLEHVDRPVEIAFKNLWDILKMDGVLILSVPYVTDAVSLETIEHFVPHKQNRVVVEDGREYLITDNGHTYTNLAWHGGPGSVLERRVFAEAALKSTLVTTGFRLIEICEPLPKIGVIYNLVGSKILICRKEQAPNAFD